MTMLMTFGNEKGLIVYDIGVKVSPFFSHYSNEGNSPIKFRSLTIVKLEICVELICHRWCADTHKSEPSCER